MKSTLVIALAAFALTASAALAQTAPAVPAAAPSKMAPAAHAKGAMTAKPRSAASLACSKKADGMNVHGAKRKTFMSSCKKAGGPT